MVQSVGEQRLNCPPAESLALALSSADKVSPELAVHIETCLNCQKQLDQLTSGSKLIEYSHSKHGVAETLSHSANPTNGNYDQDRNGPPQLEPSDPVDAYDFPMEMIGDYRLQQKLGEGGMGVVYAAEDTLLKRLVALKLMKPGAASKQEYRQRFLREAQSAAKVTHDNICPIYQVGEANGIPYIAMPLLQGETLEQHLRRQPLTLNESLHLLHQAAEGAAAAHAAGLIHRDIKPSNIWLEERPQGGIRVRLLDFGLARCEMTEPAMTLSGTILGTPSYMAPEQARGEAVDQRADLFSLGAVAYEMFSGKRAFSGSSALEVLSRILTHDPVSLASENRNVPEPLSNLVRQLLRKNVSERIPSAQVLASQIVQIREQLQFDKPSTRDVRTQTSSRRGGKSRVATWLTLGGFMAILATIVILILQTSNGTLIVEFDDSTDVRVKNGLLQIHDEDGNLRYTLGPSANQQQVATGKYHVNVTGADGLTVDTEKFELKRGETVTVRVTAKPTTATENPETLAQSLINPSITAPSILAPSIPAPTVVEFPGKLIMRDEFDEPQRSVLPVMVQIGESKQIANGIYTYALDAKAARGVLTLPIVKYESRLKSLAFVAQCRASNGHPFINFCAVNDGSRNYFFSLALNDGIWQLYIARKHVEDGVWVLKPAILHAFDNVVDPQLMPGQWIELAARWGVDDYDLWINGKHVAGGELPEELKISDITALQFCATSHAAGPTTLELASLKVWDQLGIAPAESAPQGLPLRPK